MTKPKAQPDETAAVLAANRAFYKAFRDRDMSAMERLWAESVEVVCVHPGWEALTNRTQVVESWRGILESPSSPPIRCQDESVRLMGGTALVLCTEMIGDRALVATNLFVREGDAWRMALHHATPTARDTKSRPAATPKTLH